MAVNGFTVARRIAAGSPQAGVYCGTAVAPFAVPATFPARPALRPQDRCEFAPIHVPPHRCVASHTVLRT